MSGKKVVHRIPKEFYLVSNKNRVFVDKRKEELSKTCRKKININEDFEMSQVKKLVKLHSSYKEHSQDECCGNCKFILDDETNFGPVDREECMHPSIDRENGRVYNRYVNVFIGKCDLYKPKEKKVEDNDDV